MKETLRLPTDLTMRAVRRSDNPALATLIRQVMTEYHVVEDACAAHGSEVDGMWQAYQGDRAAYFVVTEEGGEEILGGGGFGPLPGPDASICELRKMYFLPAARGRGMGRRLLARCLEEAKVRGYRRCCLVTVDSMGEARRLYERAGFRPLEKPLGEPSYTVCDRWFVRDL
jgi:putative acetyltransferase